MAERRFKGITINEASFQGEVVGDPVIVGTENNRCAFINLATYVREMNQNQQWVDAEMTVPLLVLDQKKVESVEKYIKDGRILHVRAYYKAWQDQDGAEQHGMVVMNMQFGRARFDPDKYQNTGGGIPSVPMPG